MSDTGDLATATVVAPAPSEGTRKRNVSVRYEQVQCCVMLDSFCQGLQTQHLGPVSETRACLQYRDERDLPTVMNLIDNELSEPYSIFTYRSAAIARNSAYVHPDQLAGSADTHACLHASMSACPCLLLSLYVHGMYPVQFRHVALAHRLSKFAMRLAGISCTTGRS